MENPVVTGLKNKDKEMGNFLNFLGVNHKRNAIKITISFKHKRFRDEGFATLNMEGIEMERIVRHLRLLVEEERANINGTIKRYEGHSGSRRHGSVDSMDNK